MSKFWIISDTHFGAHNNNKNWENIMCKWMDEYFFDLLSKHYEDGDVLVHLGDVFDNRQSVSLSSMNIAIDFFEKLSKYFKQSYVICGNHDAYYTTKNDITSLECIKHIPGIYVLKEPELFELFGKKCLFFPWTENKNYFKKIIIEKNPDILFCHTEFYGCIMNSTMSKSNNDFEIPNIPKIYSGHIHHRQRINNLTYVGSPYMLTQNDRGNSKGIWTYDLINNIEKFYYNSISPEFIRLDYEHISDNTLEEFIRICENKFVEVLTDNILLSRCNFSKLLSLVQNTNIMDLSFVPTNNIVEKSNITMSSCISLNDMLDEYIDKYIDCDEMTKKSVKIIAKKLINE